MRWRHVSSKLPRFVGCGTLIQVSDHVCYVCVTLCIVHVCVCVTVHMYVYCIVHACYVFVTMYNTYVLCVCDYMYSLCVCDCMYSGCVLCARLCALYLPSSQNVSKCTCHELHKQPIKDTVSTTSSVTFDLYSHFLESLD